MRGSHDACPALSGHDRLHQAGPARSFSLHLTTSTGARTDPRLRSRPRTGSTMRGMRTKNSSSKPVRSCSPRLGRFDSGAAPLSRIPVAERDSARSRAVHTADPVYPARHLKTPAAGCSLARACGTKCRVRRRRWPGREWRVVLAGHDGELLQRFEDGPHRLGALRERRHVASAKLDRFA